jgi:hypothetical protein
MSKSSDRYLDPLYHRMHYRRNKETILAWRKRPEQIAKQKAYKAANHEKYLEAQRRYKERHPERLKAYRERPDVKARRKISGRRQWLERYGITPEQFDAMLLSQGHKCAICRTDKPGGTNRRFHVDHCHTTQKVRELLCNKCNAALGYADDNPAILFAAAQYLLRHRSVQDVS